TAVQRAYEGIRPQQGPEGVRALIGLLSDVPALRARWLSDLRTIEDALLPVVQRRARRPMSDEQARITAAAIVTALRIAVETLAREVRRRSCASNNARASSLGDQCDARREPSSSKIDGSTSGRPRMEPLWSQAGATSGNRSQTEPTGYRLKEEMSQPVATHGNA